MTRSRNVADLEARVPKALRRYLDDPKVREGFDYQAELIAFGQAIREMREQAGLTQERLAHLMEATQPDIARLEKGLGKKGPTLHTLIKLGGALHRNVVIGFTPVKPGERIRVEFESEDLELPLSR